MNESHHFLKAVTLVVTAFALSGCQDGTSTSHRESGNAGSSWGPTMPLRVGADGMSFPVADLLFPSESCDKVVYLDSANPGDTLDVIQGTVALPAPPPSGIGALRLLLSHNTFRDVPVLHKGEIKHTFVYNSNLSGEPGIQEVSFVGDLSGWTPRPMVEIPEGSGVYTMEATLTPGNHPYQLVINGVQGLDPHCENRMSNGMGGWNSVVNISRPNAPELSASWRDDRVVISTDGMSDVLVMLDDQIVHHGNHQQAVNLPISIAGFEEGRHHIRAWAARDGSVSQDVLIPTNGNEPILDSRELSRTDWHASTMYFLMVDRFVNGNPGNDEPVNDPAILPEANHHGGDLEGILEALNSGYFESLGMNTVWISPITANAEGAWGFWQDSLRSDITSKFSGYHGYWPVSSHRVDRRLGTRMALQQLTEKAHERGMNVVLDYVANHVHEDHPLMDLHPDWKTSLYLPDGSLNTERWDDQRLTTWFDTFMPTLDLERPEVASAMADSAVWWAYHSDIDGFRHDATKHIPESFWRLLTQRLKEAHQIDGKRLFQIGETYGSPSLISSYLSTGMLDAQFDFNLYDKAVGAIAFDDGSWKDFASTLNESLSTYGAHHLMGNITGNQDRPRFTSLADGTLDREEDMKFQGWTRNIQHGDDVGYDRMRLLMATLASIPGIPCVYYGDEIADVGGNDPDNRRMMRFDHLNSQEMATRAWTSTWMNLRRERMSLMYGNTSVTEPIEGLLRIERTYLDETTAVYLNRTHDPINLPLDGSLQPLDVLAGSMDDQGRVPALSAIALNR